MTRHFEFTEGSSKKFWEISAEGSSFTVRYGRVGTAGQTQKKEFATEALARTAAAKLIAEKTGKGYVETSETKEVVETKQPAKKPAKVEKTEIPPFALASGKSLAARALANAAERFAAATTHPAWQDAAGRTGASDREFSKLLAHLFAHGLFMPSNRVHVARSRNALLGAPPEVALSVLSALSEPLVQTEHAGSMMLAYLPVIARLHRVAAALLRAAVLPPTLTRAAHLIRALAGESLDAAEGAGAVSMVAELLPYGETAIQVVDDNDSPTPVDHAALGAALARLGGPHWIRTFPNPERLPATIAIPALKDESLEEVGRALSVFNHKMLDARTEKPARFFEVAATLEYDQYASYMRAAGIRRAASPDEIPVGGEDLLAPSDVQDDPDFANLGTARLDAWAARWLEKFPTALTATDPADDAYSVGEGLRGLALLGVPFGAALQRRLIGVPRPYPHAPQLLDVRDYFQRTSTFTEEGARALLPVLAAMVREYDGDEARGLRLALAAAMRSLPEGAAIPEELDALLSLGDGVDHDSKRAVREAVQMLPTARGERIIARTAHELEQPFEELTYAREGASEPTMRRYAQLVAAGRENETMWLYLEGQLEALGPAFGQHLARALAGEVLSDSFLERIEGAIHPEAFAHLRDAVGKNVLDLSREMKKLVAELGGKGTTVYALSPGAAATGLSRVGGLPAGFTPSDVPRHRGRKLVHAFTVELSAVPELAARYPGARTLSVWVQGYAEDPERAQALIPRTDAEIAKAPGSGGVALELLRLEVPTAMFASDAPERAEYARALLYRKAGFLLGGPIWLQTGRQGLDASFIGQYDERLAHGANFGDMGICYAFADRAEWQSH